MGLHAQEIGVLVNICNILKGFYIMGLHAQIIGELVNLCSILGGFYIAVSSCPSNRRIS